MRWYVNDVSLQDQYEAGAFLNVLQGLLLARCRFQVLSASFYTTRSITDRLVGAGRSFRELLGEREYRELRSSVLIWLDRKGPFVDDDRFAEQDDYFECGGIDVTDTGLGEATRRVKSSEEAIAFSFPGGVIEFGRSPLIVDHGLPEDRLGSYDLPNLWTVDQLSESAMAAIPEPGSWQELVEAARLRFPRLAIPDVVFTDSRLAREPFDAAIRDRTMALLECLDRYMGGRNPDGSEGAVAKEVVSQFFNGDRALFSGESATNQRSFARELTFPDPGDSQRTIFGHWHGKISHRYFRLHFEWPVPADANRLNVLYLGPKLTKG